MKSDFLQIFWFEVCAFSLWWVVCIWCINLLINNANCCTAVRLGAVAECISCMPEPQSIPQSPSQLQLFKNFQINEIWNFIPPPSQDHSYILAPEFGSYRILCLKHTFIVLTVCKLSKMYTKKSRKLWLLCQIVNELFNITQEWSISSKIKTKYFIISNYFLWFVVFSNIRLC